MTNLVNIVARYPGFEGDIIKARCVMPVRSLSEYRELCKMCEKHEWCAESQRWTFHLRD